MYARRLLFSLVISLFITSISAAQTTHFVKSLSNNGLDGLTLREVIAAASNGDTIEFAVTGKINVYTPLVIDKNVHIKGPGARSLSIDGSSYTTVFSITSPCTVSGLTVEDGSTLSNGGGFVVNAAGVVIRDCRIINNYAEVYGSAIYQKSTSNGLLSVINCEISGNSLVTGNGAAIYNESLLDVETSTVSGNYCGAIYSHSALASTRVTNCTIVNNGPAFTSAAIHASEGASFLLRNSAIANNPNDTVANFVQTGADPSVILSGYNIVSNDTNNVIDGFDFVSDRFDTFTAPALAFNGGQTQTSAITYVWINDQVPVGTNGMDDYDQNYRFRGTHGDVGAHELNGSTPTEIEVRAIPLVPVTTTHDDSIIFKARLTIADGATSFGLEYDDNALFTSPTVTSSTSSLTEGTEIETSTLNIGFNTTYYVRAFAVNAASQKFYSGTLSGTTPDVPDLNVTGNAIDIDDGDATPSTMDGTDFGTVRIGSTRDRTFVLGNVGSKNLTITSISEPTAFSSVSEPSSVAASSSGNYGLRFTPVSPGTFAGSVSIDSNDPNENPYTFAVTGTAGYSSIAVTGNGNAITNGSTTPSTTNDTDFGVHDITAGTITKTFTITNSGNLASGLGVSITEYSSNSSFSLNSLSSVSVAGGNGTQTVSIDFSPTVPGSYAATITVSCQDWQDTTYSFAVSGEAFAAPAFTTDDAANVLAYTATLGGSITDDGGNTISEQGIVYGIATSPTVSETKLPHSSTGEVIFSDTASGLTEDTTYYFRPYAITNNGTFYGTEKTFRTIMSVSLTIFGSGTGSGTITSDVGGINAIWNGSSLSGTTSAQFDPGTNVELTVTPDGSSLFNDWSGGLSGNANPDIITLSSNSSVTASLIPKVEPSFTTDDARAITSDGATISANLADLGNLNVSERGLVYGTTMNPTTSGSKYIDPSSGAGAYTTDVTGLTDGTEYYYRPYAIHDDGTTYGPEKSFTTLQEFTLTITGSGTGSGGVTSNAGGITVYWDGSTLTGTSTAVFDAGADVELSATVGDNSLFDSWSGDASGNANPLTLTMDGDKTVDAAFNLNQFKVSGTILLVGEPLAGVQVTLGGQTTTTNADGDYSFLVISATSGTIQPVSGSYQFDPASIDIDNITADSSGNDFAASTTYNLSGYAYFRGSPLSGVKLNIGDLGALTDSNGYYSIEVNKDFSGSLSASRSGFTFLPSQISVAPVRSNQLNLDFTGRLTDQKAAWPAIRYFIKTNDEADHLNIVELRWAVDNVDSVSITGVGENLPALGSATVTVKGPRTLLLTAMNDLDRQTAQVKVYGPKEPRILWFTSETGTDKPLSSGDSTTLSYATRHTQTTEMITVTASTMSELEQKSGELTVSPTETSTYTLTAENNGMTRNKHLTLEVIDTPIIDQFEADRQVLMPGEEVTLSWRTRKADSVEIERLAQGLTRNGSITLSPTETTSFRLVAANSAGDQSHELTVAVHDADELADLAVELQAEETGVQPDAGSSVQITVTVTNNGSARAENVELIISSGGFEQFRLPMGAIGSGGNKKRTRQIVLPARGNVEVKANATTETPECNLTDNSTAENIQTKRVTGVDLVVGNPVLEITPAKGVYRFSVVIVNVGTKHADAFQADIYLSEESPIRTAKSLVLSTSVEQLRPGQNTVVGGFLYAEPGTSYLLLSAVDVFDVTADENPANNTKIVRIRMPDEE